MANDRDDMNNDEMIADVKDDEIVGRTDEDDEEFEDADDSDDADDLDGADDVDEE